MTKYDHLSKEELLELIKQQEKELKTKKYWLVWDSEKVPEKVVMDCERQLPILQRIDKRTIKTDDTDDNILIEWDNYHALTVLNYTHQEKIDVIYIDPPYNTGNEDFIYNDKYVDKEDGYRHSKWLNFMEKRLNLAKQLLKDDWVIFLSIDDNEQANLRLLCDKIFWEKSFVWQWMWFKSATPPNLSHKVKKNLEYVLAYEKVKNSNKYRWVMKTSKSDDPITKPQNSIKQLIFPPNTLNVKLDDWKVVKWIYWTKTYPNKLLNDLIVGNWLNKNEVIFENRFVWTQGKLDQEIENWTTLNLSKNLVISYKKSSYSEEVPPNLIDDTVWVWTTEEAGKHLTQMFWEKMFDYPKNISLIQYLLRFKQNSQNDLILDFFAGTWTTWHAVLGLNKEDWGNRKFILCTNNENNICEEVTYPRIEKVIKWYATLKWKKIEWLNGNLKYFKTDLIDSTQNIDQVRYNLTQKCTEMLCIKENIFNLEKDQEDYKIYVSNDKKRYLCVYYNLEEKSFDAFLQEVKKIDGEKSIYQFSPDNYVDESVYKGISNISIEPIPHKILEVYKQLISLNIKQK